MNLPRILTISPKKIVPIQQSEEYPPQIERKKRASRTYIHSANNLPDEAHKKKLESITSKAQSHSEIPKIHKRSPDQDKQNDKKDSKTRNSIKFEAYEERFDLKQIILAKKFAMKSNPRNRGSPRKELNIPEYNSRASIDQGLVSPLRTPHDSSPSKMFGNFESPRKKSRFSFEQSPQPRGSIEVEMHNLKPENEIEQFLKVHSVSKDPHEEPVNYKDVEEPVEDIPQQLETDRTEGHALYHTQSVVDEAAGEDFSSDSEDSGSFSSESSVMDTLVEDNPYEERKVTMKRSFTVKLNLIGSNMIVKTFTS